MNARQQKTVARFGQVLTFLDANPSVVPPASVAIQRQVLASAVTQITGFAQDQVLKGSESVLAQTVSSARTALRDTYMRQLSTVGLHALTGKQPTDPNVPGASQIFALPATRTNPSALIDSAKAMVSAATAYASVFASASVNLAAVTAAIDALQAAVNAEGSAKRVAKGATQGIKAQVQAGQGAVRLMDVIIRPLLAANKPLLTQWESVKRAAGGVNLATPVPVPVASQQTAAPAPAAPATPTVPAPAPAAPTAPAPAPAPASPAPSSPATA